MSLRTPAPAAHDGFALIPEDGRPYRLLRFTNVPDSRVLSMLDSDKNILRINTAMYEQLPDKEQRRLATTHAKLTELVVDDDVVTYADDPAE